MKVAWKFLKWLALLGLLILLTGIVYIGSAEVYLYLTQSDVKAQAAAQELFSKICDRQRIDSRSFHGPDRPYIEQDKKNGQYSFIWSRSPSETIYINVSYLPYDFGYSISVAITERKTPHNPK